MTHPAPISNSDPNGRLKTMVDRIERLVEEKAAIASDIRDIYAEAKDNGYNTKVLRAVISRRGQDAKALTDFDAELDRYEAALGVKP